MNDCVNFQGRSPECFRRLVLFKYSTRRTGSRKKQKPNSTRSTASQAQKAFLRSPGARLLVDPNPDKPEPKKNNHESTKNPRLNKEKRINGAGENTKKDEPNFVLTRRTRRASACAARATFRVFVVEIFFHKMQRIHS
jgi:hypothetical protein